MSGDAVLAVWSAVAIAWWLLAWRLVRRATRHPLPRTEAVPAGTGAITVFKPLPPLGTHGLSHLEPGLESFIAQLGPEDELLLGIHEADRAAVAPFVERMRARYPRVRLRTLFRTSPDDAANPKIAWQRFLAPQAENPLWLWSDADIAAPPGFLRAAAAELAGAGPGIGLLTFPYVVRNIASGPALFDALFVNAEFYPGVLLLRERGPVDFGLGSALLFRRDDFLRRADWEELGAALADDFVLGQQLGPVRVGGATLCTLPEIGSWREALRHYLRWSKTVAWNRPLGSAARIVVLPLAGWMAAVALHPGSGLAWGGFLAMMQLEVGFAWLLCRRADCRWNLAGWVAAEAWTLWRVAVWLACLLPGGVNWRGRTWHGPRFRPVPEEEPVLEASQQVFREGIDNE